MSKRVCRQPGCPRIQDAPQCEEHRREQDKARGTTTQRGYGREHQAGRRRWAPLVAAGKAKCWRCGQLIQPTEPWDYGHDDHDRTVWRGPEHMVCNRSAAGKASH